MSRIVGNSLILAIGIGLGSPSIADDSPLTLPDFEAYRLALQARPTDSAPPVKFRDLWDRPADYLGKPVQVEGRVARVFRQGRFGEFPPLVEAWVVSPAGDPFCLVFPPTDGQPAPRVGSSIRFSGTFLKRIQYDGGDTPRIAPLVVGPQAPEIPKGDETPESSWTSTDWLMAAGALLVVATVLTLRHLARPVPRAARPGPAPAFLDGGEDPRLEYPDEEVDPDESAR